MTSRSAYAQKALEAPAQLAGPTSLRLAPVVGEVSDGEAPVQVSRPASHVVAPVVPIVGHLSDTQTADNGGIQTVLVSTEPATLQGPIVVKRPSWVADESDAPKPKYVYGNTAVGTSGGFTTISTTFTASTTVTGSAAYTLGATGQDFYNVGTGTCDTNGYPYTYAASANCTLVIGFTPTKVGRRLGAAVLYTSTGYYYALEGGNGLGPLVSFLPPTPAVSTLASGLTASGVATDAFGNLWVSDSAGASVKEYVPSGGVYPASPTNTFTGFTTPQGLAFDGMGNLYVGDGGKGYVWKLPATNGVIPAGTAPSSYVTFLSAGAPVYVAFDPTGNLFMSGTYSSTRYLIKCVVTTGSCSLVNTYTAGAGIAIDGTGAIFVADTSAKVIYKTASGSTTKTIATPLLTAPVGVAVDAAGNLYVADQGNGTSGSGTITEVLATAGSTSSSSTTKGLASGFYNPSGVFLDPVGNVYIADTGNTAAKLLDLYDSPGVDLPNTAVNGVSAPALVTVQNTGNASLIFSVPASGTNPVVPDQFTLSTSSSTCPIIAAGGAAGTVAYGTSCTYVVNYAPTITGAGIGYLTVTDNNQNAANSSQIIKLAGSTGGYTVVAADTSAAQGSSAITLVVTVGYGSGTTPTGVPFVTINGSASGVGTFTCKSKLAHFACAATYNGSALSKGNYTIGATMPPNGPYSATSGTATLTIN